jgi:hypothetical protein
MSEDWLRLFKRVKGDVTICGMILKLHKTI